MGVFKWLRRERVTVTTSQINQEDEDGEATNRHVGTIRTEEYKRDLAEFQARRSGGYKELEVTPSRKKCGRHSLPVSCTDCTGDPDRTFNYEKKSALKYKKQLQKRARSANSEEKVHDGVPNVQFLFQNQVFMPGNVFPKTFFSEPRQRRRWRSPEFLMQKHINFDDEQPVSPPVFFKNNSLPYDVKNFLDSKSDEEEVDGFVDEKRNSADTSRTDDSKSDASTFGLPIASSCNLNMSFDKNKRWCHGKWGVVPVQLRTLHGITVEQVKKKRCMEMNILGKCRHPNVILLMGFYADAQNNVHIICERTIDTIFNILHEQGRVVSTQTAVHYALDIANALTFLKMHGYMHTDLNSESIMVSSHDTAKLADLSSCVKVPKFKRSEKNYDAYSPEPLYVNIEDTCKSRTTESEPLLSARSSECLGDAVTKEYKAYSWSEYYRWQSPELFEPDEDGFVHPCSKSDVYSLCLILWECCNATIPWKCFTYEKLKEIYTISKTGLCLPQDGTYPGCLLSLLRSGLAVSREQRIDLATLQSTLMSVKNDLNEMEYIIIPQRLFKKRSELRSPAWDSTTPTDSDCISPKNIEHDAIVHTRSPTGSENKSCSPIYHTIRKTSLPEQYDRVDKCFISDEDLDERLLKQDNLDKDYSSACSTPISKFRERIKDTPGTLHRSDSTEYCSILSPDAKHFALNDTSNKDQNGERSSAKLSRSFTPKSYKPLQIKVPDFNLDSIRDILKDNSGNESASYNFDIKNYSLPNTPIARSTKLRKNAWLSGELSVKGTSSEKLKVGSKEDEAESILDDKKVLSECSSMPAVNKPVHWEESECSEEQNCDNEPDRPQTSESEDTVRDSYTGLKRVPDPPADFSPEREVQKSSKPRPMRGPQYAVEEDVLASVNVKPLVAIHERWICEANKKTVRSFSLPEDKSKNRVQAVKPASHCVDTMQKSLPQLYFKPSMTKPYRPPPVSPASTSSWKSGSPWEQFFQTREMSKSFPPRDFELGMQCDADKSTITDENIMKKQKIDRGTDTQSIEEFIRDLIRKEFQYLLQDSSDNSSEASSRRTEDLVNKGVANVLDSLDKENEKKSVKSFSTIKINGNNKPLVQITFSRSGENSLQVLDNCVNVTIGEGGGKEKLNQSIDDTLTEEQHINALKRCQAFNAIQEAKSTEDLYIDDDISTHMQENFGGKLIPLHGSLHEILCEKKDDCCLIKIKQESGCDPIYFKCDSDTESRDSIDGKDTVVFKRSISVIEERIQRVLPKDKRPNPVAALRKLSDKLKSRPKSETFIQNICKESRVLSNSSPCLFSTEKDEVEVNIENVMCYQDSSSDECIKCQDNDDFEIIEREIEEDLASSNFSSLTCGCLEKISEEDLSVINEEEKIGTFSL